MSRGKFVPKVPTLKQQKARHRLVRPTDTLKSFAAGQQDREMQFKLTTYQNHIIKISLTPLQVLEPYFLFAVQTKQGYYQPVSI